MLRQADGLRWDHALYAPGGRPYSEETPVLVWDVDDVSDDTDLPAEAIALGYDYVLGIQDVQGIVQNARQQRPDTTSADLLAAFHFYLDNDAFILWAG
ncbi:DUF7716 domain-containing protein [Jiangella rhizosphaerae]|uniref:DUF7716 domain-containing protein n=1 Tax=Jiangella rhizosphaerae TaxID=2293569 RepID=UPI0011C37EF5|nr:hypothetical protein [Jiangella rhizosphaerae]